MANTAVFTARDGKRQAFPLDYLVRQGAVLASAVNGESLAEALGGSNQLWIPGCSGNNFLRDVVRVEFEERPDDQVPAPPAMDGRGLRFPNRPNCSAKISGDVGLGGLHMAGMPVEFEGYADDFDRRIDAVEFSMDGGATWDVRPTEGGAAGPWTYWHYDFTPDAPGHYELLVRAVNEDGTHTPTPASVLFTVM